MKYIAIGSNHIIKDQDKNEGKEGTRNSLTETRDSNPWYL